MKKALLVFCCCLIAAAVMPQFRASTGVARRPEFGAVNARPASPEGGPSVTRKELAGRADLVVVGECVGSRSAWVDDGRRLVTLAAFSVNETLKGEELGTVTVVLPGGTDADRKVPVTMSYPGAPTLRPREQALLFLSRQTQVEGGYAIAGSAHGKLLIEAHGAAEGARRRDEPLPQGGDRVVRDGGRRVPLSKLREEIKSYLRQ